MGGSDYSMGSADRLGYSDEYNLVRTKDGDVLHVQCAVVQQ